MSQKKKEEEDSPVLKVVTMHRLEDNRKTRRGRLITVTRNNTDNTSINRTKITRKQKWGEKQLYGYFKRQTSEIFQGNTWAWLKNGNFKRETESPLIAAQNNAIRTNYVKAWIDKTQQNSRYGFCDYRDEKINYIIRECSKLAQNEYKTRHDWVRKVINSELYKKFRFNHTYKWYMHNLESVLENEMHKLLRDFEIQTDHLISARRPDLVIVNKKRTCQIVNFAVLADHRVKLKANEKRDKD